MVYRIARCGVVLLVAAMLGGCSKPAGPDLGTVPVEGTVTYNGAPVAGADVTFSPDGGGKAAAGRTDNSGRFVLTTQAAGDGAVPGKYNVAVAKTAVEGGANNTAGMTPEEANAASYAAHEAGAGGTVKDALPEKYKSPSTSGLTAEVTEGGDNDFTFELSD